MKNPSLRVGILLTLYGLIPLLFISLYFVGNLYEFASLIEPYNLSIIAGAGAYIVFMSQFLISARVRFLERIFGQDRLLGMHGLVGFVSGALILTHFLIKYLLIIRYGDFTLQSALGFSALLVFLVLAPVAYFVLQGRRKNLGPVDYEKARLTHNLFALAGLLAVLHVMLATSTWSLALQAMTIGWGLLTLGAYVWHKILRPRKSLGLELAEVTELAPGVHRYRFAGDGNLLPGRVSGQFAYFRFSRTPTIGEEHPFTLSSPAGENVEIIVRGSGDFSRQLSQIPRGSQVRVDGPYGRFHPFDLAPGTPLLFLAGGIGVTPFLSMMRDSALRTRHPMTLVWSIPGPEDAVVVEPLSELVGRVKILYTRRAPSGGVVSRIDGNLLGETLKANPSAVCFLCGPGSFVPEITAELRRQGVTKSRIFSERFSW